MIAPWECLLCTCYIICIQLYDATDYTLFYAAPKRTETSFDTPGSCMVTPYSTGAMLMVFLLCVISTNWVWMLISLTRSVKRPMLASSSGASTSSRMQNGLGVY